MFLDTNGQPHLDTIHHCDALDLLRALPDGCIDLICVDMPYNVSQKGANLKRVDFRKKSFRNRGSINYDFGKWDYESVRWQHYLSDYYRVLKPCGVLVLFHNRIEVGLIAKRLEIKYKMKVRHIGAWVKSNPVPQLKPFKWSNGLEFFIVATKNKGQGHHFNSSLGYSVDYFVSDVNYKHEHPNQKRLEFIEWIIDYWSYPGDTVLDCFCGSGTTAHAAYRLDRHYICGDSDAGYVAIARKRLADANAMLDKVVSETHTQLSLFG